MPLQGEKRKEYDRLRYQKDSANMKFQITEARKKRLAINKQDPVEDFKVEPEIEQIDSNEVVVEAFED